MHSVPKGEGVKHFFSKLRNFIRLDIIVHTVSFRKIMKNMALRMCSSRPQFRKYSYVYGITLYETIHHYF
jgi:hypothetical protein